MTIAGCGPARPASAAAHSDATISGSVRAPEGTVSTEGRIVEIVNLETNERQRVSTNTVGAFAFRVKPGKYRVHLTLREGEALVKQPEVMDISHTDDDAHADFIVGSGRVSRPRGPAYRIDDGLGSPVA